ncbi:hypothetical protein Golomagni_06464 [Golovinomyces magnicellulatus]|nr:hypothetical protein Golomagni_06464 [Golovinomyces magnicellulatus]
MPTPGTPRDLVIWRGPWKLESKDDNFDARPSAIQRNLAAMPLVDPITMSTTSSKTTSVATTDSKAKFTMLPAHVADEPLAKAIAFARPAVLFAILGAGMKHLIATPVWTLQMSLPVIAAVQIVYAVVCLPVVGSSLGKARKTKKNANNNTITTAILSLVLAAISTPGVYILFVLFGAPFLIETSHTLLCAAHFSLLGLFPAFFVRGVDNQVLVAVAGASAPFDETYGALVGAVLGAWLGAIPIPLDWDRDWQKWPVTIVVGMYIGSCLGSLAGGSLLFGKRMSSGETVAKEDKEE